MDPAADHDTVATTGTTFEILDALREQRGARIGELSERLDPAPSTIHRHLATLLKHGYVLKRGDEYEVSLKFLKIGCEKRRHNPVYEMAREKVDLLAEETEERAQFVVEERGKLVYLYYSTNSNAVQTDGTVGKHRLLHYSAAGKAILAALPDRRVGAIIDRHGLPAKTDNSITDPEELRTELAEIRDRGVAFNDEESVEGLRAVGSAVQGPAGETFGALSVSGPAHRMQGNWYESELPNLILGIANEIELNVKYTDGI